MPLAIPLPAPNVVSLLVLRIPAFCLLWSSAFAVAKLALTDCPPLLLLTARFLLAGGILLGAAAVSGVLWRISRHDLIVLALLGVANNAVYLGLNYIGMRGISAGLSALIVSANPVLTAVLAAVFLEEKMTWRKAAGLLLGLGGVAFIVESRITNGLDSPTGIAFTVAALVSLVGGTILFKRLAPKGALWIGNGVQNLAGGLALMPFALSLESMADVVPSWRLLIAIAYLGLLVSVVGFLIWFQLLTAIGATAASAYHFLMPPLGMLFGWLLLNEHVAWPDLIGVLPVALGIYLVTRTGRSPSRTATVVTAPKQANGVATPPLVVSIPPEHHRSEPAGGDRHHCGRHAIEQAVVARGGSDDLLEPGFVDLEGGRRARDLGAIGEQPDVHLVGSDRHLGRQRDRCAEQRRRQEGDPVRNLTVESLIALDLDEGEAKRIVA
jgi:drug/metabolite transporter (DMT)-like permease